MSRNHSEDGGNEDCVEGMLVHNGTNFILWESPPQGRWPQDRTNIATPDRILVASLSNRTMFESDVNEMRKASIGKTTKTLKENKCFT